MRSCLLALILGSALVLQATAQSDPVCNACPSKNCTYDKTLTCRCVGLNGTIQIVDPGDHEYFNVSLGFAVDESGSMGTEIASVKFTIQSVVTATWAIFDKFVIDTFNDPYVFNLIESRDPVAINNFVGAINAHSGGDCPEMALRGIMDIAKRVSPGSVIFAFTDASAKDLDLEAALTTLLVSKNIRLNVMATGDLCGGLGAEFTRLTKATNGTIYKTPNKADVDFVMNYIKNFAKYGIRFIRGMPKTLEDLKALANGTCSCTTSVSNVLCSPPSVNECKCPKGYEQVEVKKKVCHHGLCTKPKYGTLGFVVDDTGSMGAEMSAVKSHIKAIMTKNSQFKDFLVARFGDPYVKNLLRSSNIGAIQAFVDKLVATDGGDCPDFAMSGIEDAAKEAHNNSVLVLFTDGPAKDAGKLAAVKTLLMAKKVKLFAIATGTFCGSGVYKGEFHDLAKATGGGFMTLTSKTSAPEVLSFLGLETPGGKDSLLPFTSHPTDLAHVKPMNCCEWVTVLECIKIKKPCPPGFVRRVQQRKVCIPADECRPEKNGSLGFVIDDSGSMGAVILAVKTQIGAIIANNTVFIDYVVARYGDPYVKNVIRSDSATVIQSFVNTIVASGGGDCPEFAMAGIRDAALEARKSSVLILFTDASAKDHSRRVEIATLLLSKNIKLFVIATGTFCGPSEYRGEFDYLASATGGKVMKLSAKTSVSEVLDFVSAAAAGLTSFEKLPSSLADLHKTPRTRRCFDEEIDTCVCKCLDAK